MIESIGNVQFICYCYAICIGRCEGCAFITFFAESFVNGFHVFLISDLYLSNVDAKNCCLAADMLLLKILIKVVRLMLNSSHSLEPGLVNLIFLYKLSLNLIDRNSPPCIHFDLLCLYLLNITSLLVICVVLVSSIISCIIL